MANLSPPIELHRLDSSEALQTPLNNEPQLLNDRASSPPCDGQESRPCQSPERPAGPPRRISQEAATEDPEEESTLLPREDTRLSSPEDLRSSSEDEDKTNSKISSVTLHRSGYIVVMVSIYASSALTAWILICLLTFRPVTMKQYGYNAQDSSLYKVLQAKYDKSEEVYRAARTVQAVVTVLTIPLTSAVCSAAAVIFAQSQRKEQRLTMRQMMVLADKGWTDPTTIVKLITGRGKRLSSSLLICALLLNVFGASITTLQTLLLSQKTIKVPSAAASSYYFTAPQVVDIPDKFGGGLIASQTSLVTILTRNALKSTFNTTPQPHLWQEGIGCSSSNKSQTEQCVLGTSTLSNLSALSSPYLAQLPVGYHTGLIKQLIPRINSTVKWENVSAEDMPVNCGEMPDSFYALYANATWPPEEEWHLVGGAPSNWSIEICMPGNQSASPWKNTYIRQDFSEELFLNISVMGYGGDLSPVEGPDSPTTGGIFRITSNTTAGYFELPNYMNGGQAGPIIDGDPDDSDYCGSNCRPQNRNRQPIVSRAVPPVSNLQSNGSLGLAVVENRGPLLTIAIALFGYDSFIPARLSHQETFIRDYDSYPTEGGGSSLWADYALACVDQKPLASLLLTYDEARQVNCITDTVQSAEELNRQIVEYVQSFYPSGQPNGYSNTYEHYPERLTNAFSSAVYLATEAWLSFGLSDYEMSRYVYSDPGHDLAIPAISRAGMIIISSLWAIYIACLLSLAIYSARAPRWTNQLDAFAMMRVGAATDKRIGLKVGFEAMTIDALDELPGAIGDATGGEGDVGVLGMGASTPLNGIRSYECYRGDEIKADLEALEKAQRQYAAYGKPPTDFEHNGKIYIIRASNAQEYQRHLAAYGSPPTQFERGGKVYTVRVTSTP